MLDYYGELETKSGSKTRLLDEYIYIVRPLVYGYLPDDSNPNKTRLNAVSMVNLAPDQWTRISSDRNKAANQLRWKAALKRLPKFKLKGMIVDALPEKWVKQLRGSPKLRLMGDDGTSWIKLRKIVHPVAKPYYATIRYENSKRFRKFFYKLTHHWLPHYYYKRELMPPSLFHGKGGSKVNYAVTTVPTRIERLIPSGMFETFKTFKVPGLRNYLHYDSSRETDWCMLIGYGTPFIGDPVRLPWSPPTITASWLSMAFANMDSNPYSVVTFGFDPQWEFAVDNPLHLPSLFSDKMEELDAKARERLWKSVQRREVNYATEIAQLSQTFDMFCHLTKRLASVLLHLKKFDVAGAVKDIIPTSKKALADDFLMFQFGVRPLVEDVALLYSHLKHFLDVNAVQHAEGHATYRESTMPDSLKPGFFMEYYDGDGSESEFHTYCNECLTGWQAEVRVKYSWDLKVVDLEKRAEAFLGITAPEETVWELVPFSFVVDWLISVGDAIEKIHAFDGLVPGELWKTTYYKLVENQVQNASYRPEWSGFNSPNGIIPPGDHGSTGFVSKVAYSRFREKELVYVTREPVEALDFEMPTFKNPFTSYHIAEALALITQLKHK